MANTQHQKEQFEKKYFTLNQQQKIAVDTIEGPVIVNAGPGTGKTQILAMRIGRILLETDTNPNNILCLTYTDNGAVEMRNRLLQIVGTPAYNIQIHTFHSFCNQVIQDNLSYFGKLSLELLSDLEEIDLFNKLIDSIEKDSPLKRFRGEVYYEAPRLKSLFSLMKKEALGVQYMNERIDAYLKTLPTRDGFFYKKKYKEFVAGDPNPNKIAPVTENMEVLRAAVKLFPRYNAMMAERSRYNFDDMILWVLDAFEKNKNMLLDYQERFLYFLVDEFQDTSRSQNLLLQHLINYWDTPNVFVVGDADQSIFSFQDANVENIIEFEKKYEGEITRIKLENNYRSTQTILDLAHKLISNNSLRTVDVINDKPLLASKEGIANLSSSPAIIEYPNTTHEAMDIALQIEHLLKDGVSGKNIAIIYRNHAQVEQIATILESKSISVNTRKKVDILQLPFIKNILDILTWIDKESTIAFSGEDLLFKILHFNFFKAKPADIAHLNMKVNAKNVGRKEDRYSMRRELSELSFSNGDLFTQPDNTLKLISNTLEELLKDHLNFTLQQLLEKLIQKAGVLAFVMQSPEKPWLMQVLNAFFQYVKECCKKDPDISLHELLMDISLMKKNRLSIPLYKVVALDEGINLITAHGSKGSEYAHVFVIGCTNGIWDESNKGNNRTYSYPDNLLSDHNDAGDLEESRRLFYVAVTRAKSNLQISYSLKDKNDKPLTKSTFVTEIQEGMGWQPISKSVNDEQLIDYLALQFTETAMPEIELVEANYIDQILKRYTLSVTHLNNYLNCPLKFYYQNLIRVPAAKNENMAFGSAVHFVLQRLFEKMKQNDSEKFPPKESLLEDFSWFMDKNKDSFTPEAFKLKMDYGEKILPAYYETHINNWNKAVSIERNIRNVYVQDVPLNGKLDKLEFNGKLVNVVDYKTGSFDNAKKKLVSPGEKEPNGGDYWRQAVFYKILLDNDKTNDWQAISASFEFIEPINDEYKVEKITVSPEDIATVTHQIKTVWNQIQQKEFKTGCGKPECEWCNFVKTNQMAVALHDLSEEDEMTE